MSFSSFRYLIREGFRNIWQNRLMSLASIGVLISCLLITSFSYLVFENMNHMFSWVNRQNIAVAFAKEGCTDEQLQVVLDKIKGITNVADVEFISKEQAFEKYKDSIPEELREELQGENNPYLDSYIIEFSDLSKFEDSLNQIKQIPEIDSTVYDADIAKSLSNVRHIVLMVGGWVIVLLLLVSLFIIANTIKLTVYNRRLEISIMKSVGATNTFIKVPFIIEGIVLGIISALISFGLIYLIYSNLFRMFDIGFFGGLLAFSKVWSSVLLGCVAIGIGTGVAGSAISIRKYLKVEGGISGVI
ncbi:MAG TPA: ABC transporter permease [Clostridiales bacterium]|nr:ABC transporter permease [Clostridiales bacterium]